MASLQAKEVSVMEEYRYIYTYTLVAVFKCTDVMLLFWSILGKQHWMVIL